MVTLDVLVPQSLGRPLVLGTRRARAVRWRAGLGSACACPSTWTLKPPRSTELGPARACLAASSARREATCARRRATTRA